MWQERLFPELKLLETTKDRRELLTAVERRTVGLGKRIALVVALAVVVGSLCAATLYTLSRWWPIPQSTWGAISGAIVGGTSALSVQIFWRRPLQREIRRELNRRGVPICVRCGYNLHGLAEPRCPECGTPFEA